MKVNPSNENIVSKNTNMLFLNADVHFQSFIKGLMLLFSLSSSSTFLLTFYPDLSIHDFPMPNLTAFLNIDFTDLTEINIKTLKDDSKLPEVGYFDQLN